MEKNWGDTPSATLTKYHLESKVSSASLAFRKL